MGLGTTEYVHIIRSGYSSRIFEMRSVPIPAPVPPPRECVIWKPEGGVDNRTKHVTREANRGRLDAYQLTLKTISALSLLPNDIKDGIDEFSTLRVVCRYVSKSTCSKTTCHKDILVYSRPFAQLLPAPLWPNTKLSGRKRPPRGPDRTASMVPGSRSIRIARGTYLLAPISL